MFRFTVLAKFHTNIPNLRTNIVIENQKQTSVKVAYIHISKVLLPFCTHKQ